MWMSNSTRRYDVLFHVINNDLLQGHREQTCGCQEGEGVGEGWIRSLGLADANWYI